MAVVNNPQIPKLPGGASVPKKKPIVAVTPEQQIRQKNARLRQKLTGFTAGTPEYNRVTTRINFNRNKLGLDPRKFGQPAPATPQATTPAPEAAPQVQPQLIPVTPNPAQNADYMRIMFPDTNPYEVGDWQKSPVYNMRVQEGQNAMNKLMASRGLVGSGAELKSNADLINKITAEEGDRAYGLRGQEVANNLQRGGSFQNFLTGEADRANLQAQNQFNNMMQIYDAQTKNALINSIPEMTQYGINTAYSQAGKNAQNIAGNYKKYYGSGGGGVGPFIPAYPNQPNFAPYDAAQAIASGASSGNMWGSILGGLGTAATMYALS